MAKLEKDEPKTKPENMEKKPLEYPKPRAVFKLKHGAIVVIHGE